MVEFGKRLQEECEQHGEDWQRHCIDYNTLKSIIVESKPKSKQTQLSSTSPTNITTKHSKNRSRTISFDARNNLLLALATSDEDDWEDHRSYTNYHHDNSNSQQIVESQSTSSAAVQLSSLQFRYALDREIEKAVLYVLQTQGNMRMSWNNWP